MAQQVFPTKANLLDQKRSLALAQQGYELMDRKRNILVREIVRLIDRAGTIQGEISAAYQEAYASLRRANITLGSVGEFARSVPVEHGLTVSYHSVMGVELPTLRLVPSAPTAFYYGMESTNSMLDIAYLKFGEVKALTVELAEVESSVFRLGEAIHKTQKRANALNNIQIPLFHENIKYIGDVLEEKEREDFSRLKVVKKQKEG
ncbi:MAG: V-type ATP synthase subunit D [Oscillospiraceae bacterium]|nr:V-type ATP synthase subunit D [Oscillospiraceae bacterium]